MKLFNGLNACEQEFAITHAELNSSSEKGILPAVLARPITPMTSSSCFIGMKIYGPGVRNSSGLFWKMRLSFSEFMMLQGFPYVTMFPKMLSVNWNCVYLKFVETRSSLCGRSSGSL